VVLSNDTANALLSCVQVVPVSSQVGLLYPADAYISLNGERRKAMADQITTASKRRLLRPPRGSGKPARPFLHFPKSGGPLG
jgi:mRNA interferase MazF